MPGAMVSNNAQAYSHLAQQPQHASPRDPQRVSQVLLNTTTRLNDTLDSSNAKMQKIIDETEAQLPEQPRLPDVPRLSKWRTAAPPEDHGCPDELYTAEGCQCYKVVTSAAADLAAGLTRGLKRKRLGLDDEMEIDDWDDAMTEKDTSSLTGSEAESMMLQWHPNDSAQSRRPKMPLTRKRDQQTKAAGSTQEQRWT